MQNHQLLYIKNTIWGHGEKTRLELDFGVIPSDIADSGLTLVIDSASVNINVFIKPYYECSTQTQNSILNDKGVQTDDLNSDVVRQMFDLVPAVCEFLSKHDAIHINRLLEYMKLLASGSFPMANICYRVFLDGVQWYSLNDKWINLIRVASWFIGVKFFGH